MVWWILAAVGGLLLLVALYDLMQKRHAILRNFPVVGHTRDIFQAVGPKLRQYIVTDNNEERPFSRDERRWVYTSANRENNYFGFGTDNDLDIAPGYLIVKHSAFPLRSKYPGHEGYDPTYPLPMGKVLGAARGRKHAFRPKSVINISAMSYGSLSSRAIEALNRGCMIAEALHNTGEGGISPFHKQGGDLIYQIGTGYYGARADDGGFSMERFLDTVAGANVKAIEVKLSQGAKPGLGGVLPAAKVSAEIAEIRGIPRGENCISPSRHTAFSDVDSLLDFVESLADATGLPVGIKSAVGEHGFWHELARLMASGERGVDFIAIDGGEGGTGAAPLTFSDHVSLPFKIGFPRVFKIFADHGLSEKVVFLGSGKLGLPQTAALALAMGCDGIAVAREAMLAIGCIQAQRCHDDHCPTGVATQNKWLVHGLDPTLKSARLANYLVTLRKELLLLSHACGVEHPALIGLDRMELLDSHLRAEPADQHFGYSPEQGLPVVGRRNEIQTLMSRTSKAPESSGSVPETN